ncbi:MAG: MarR family transcriptional regulator [Oscillospiraceae bacterium]|nr:MarR family transcriptional regulator [Oscillospiraceae bacterium]
MDYKKAAGELHDLLVAHMKSGLSQRLQKAGHGEMFALGFLMKQEGCVLPSSISAAMNSSTARTASLLGALEQKGLVTRQIDPSDRRQILVSLTGEGRALAASHEEHVRDNLEKTLRSLGEDDTRELIRLITKLVGIA